MTSKPQTGTFLFQENLDSQFLMTKIQAFGKEIPSIW